MTISRLVRGAACVAYAGVHLACASAPATPAAVVQAYGDAIARRDYPAAYRLLDAEFRRRVSLDEFRRAVADDVREVADDAARLRARADAWRDRVIVALPDGERAELRREAGGWRLTRPPLAPYAQDSPRAALRAFLRAVEARRYDVLLRLAPARYRPRLDESALRAFWEGPDGPANHAALRDLRVAASGAPIVDEGDTAFMLYGANRQVRFVREDDGWKIESPE